MDFSEQNKVSAFDTLFCNNHIKMLKILLPYANYQAQKSLAVYIKFLEFQYTINFYRKNPYPLYGCMQEEHFDFSKVCSELLPYCTDNERKHLEQIQGFLRGMEMYREMNKTMEMMKEFMPDMGDIFSGDNNPFFSGNPFSDNSDSGDSISNSMDMMNILMNMLSPEQKEIFSTLGGMNHDN